MSRSVLLAGVAVLFASPVAAQTGAPASTPLQPREVIVTAPVQTSESDILQGVSVLRGDELVRELARAKGCRVVDGAAAFGSPSLARVCDGSGPDRPAEASYRGLFGDAWLTCRLSAPGATAEAEVTSRAEQWCVRVATTLGARP